MDSAWEQRKLEASKLLKNGDREASRGGADESRSWKKRGYRKTKGGRPEVRSVLHMSALSGIRYNPIIKAQYR